MSFLDGILAPALTAATSAAGAYSGAEANAAALQRQNLISALMARQQMQELQTKMALQGAQTHLAERQAGTLRLGDPGYAGALGEVAGAQRAATLPLDLKLAVQKGMIDRATAEAVAHIRTRGTISAASIGASSRAAVEQSRERSAAALQASQLAGQHANKAKEISQVQGGEIIPSLLHAPQNLWDRITSGAGGLGIGSTNAVGPTPPTAPTAPTGLFDDLPPSAGGRTP